MKYYAGIGSRETPGRIKYDMTEIALQLEEKDYVLRSGHAPGADQAFERGADRADIWVPWSKFEQHVPYPKFVTLHIGSSPEAFELAEKFHPRWKYISQGAKKLIARNGHQILGKNLTSPVQFVVCWTKDGKEVGGTAQGIRIAKHYGIPVYNLGDESGERLKEEILNGP